MSYCMDCEFNEDAGGLRGCPEHRDNGPFAGPTELGVWGEQYD